MQVKYRGGTIALSNVRFACLLRSNVCSTSAREMLHLFSGGLQICRNSIENHPTPVKNAPKIRPRKPSGALWAPGGAGDLRNAKTSEKGLRIPPSPLHRVTFWARISKWSADRVFRRGFLGASRQVLQTTPNTCPTHEFLGRGLAGLKCGKYEQK